jgi:hypothetical protein
VFCFTCSCIRLEFLFFGFQTVESNLQETSGRVNDFIASLVCLCSSPYFSFLLVKNCSVMLIGVLGLHRILWILLKVNLPPKQTQMAQE